MLLYPIYLYGFIHLGPLGQTLYLGLLPVIKLDNKYDLMAQIVIFNMDVFNAMYVSSCIQSAKSLSAILLSVGLDILFAGISMYDVAAMAKRVGLLRRKLSANHPLRFASAVQIAAQIIKEDDRA